RTYDSGDLIEQTLKANFPSVLDDGRSDDKGPEPEHVTLGRMNGDLYAFVGLERSTAGNSVVMSFRIDGPSAVTYTGPIITTGTGNQAPEAFTFVPGTVSAAGTGDPMLLIPNETAGAFRAVSLSETPAFTLQILSYYGESGLLGTKTAAKMGALIDKFDDEYTNTLVLAEGDSYIPGPWLIGGADPSLNAVPGIGTTALGRPDIAIMNAFGTDASALGNHEFDLGSPVFQAAITASGSGASAWVGAQFPFITANINTAADSSLRGISDKTLGGTGTNNFAGQETTAIKGKIAPYAISTQGGEKIGIIGITTFDLLIKSSPNGTVPKDDANPATTDIQEVAIYVQGAVDALKAMGVNKIVMVDQLDTIERNKELAPLVSGVDIMVAGGGHERLGDANDVAVGFNGHTADFLDTFPILVSGADGKPTLLVTTDTEYTYLGRLVVDFDAAGDIIVNNLNPVINGAYAATEASLQAAYGTTQTADQIIAGSTIGAKVDAITDAIQAVIAAKDGTIWGYTNVYLEGDRAFGRAQEVNFGNISADANMFKAQAALGSSAFVTSLKNGGGLRASVGSIDEDGSKIPPAANPEVGKPAGAISTLDIENALRFDNKLMVFDTTAAGLKAIMEYAAGLPAGNGGYMQIGGIRVSFDPTKAAGSKVMNIALTDASGHVIARVVENGAVVPDAPSVISMVSLNFTANGGDGYPIKANATNFRYLLTDGTLSAPINAALDFTAAANLPANALGEQKAFQEYLTAFHGTPDKAYSQADTPASQDIRIENLSARTSDVVFQGESIVGTTASETINGFAGNDTIKGGNGNDIINGGAGNDSLDGGADNDIINGGTGNDSLIGGEGNDTLNGGAGNDMLEGGGGNDVAVYAGSRDAATLVRSASGAWTVTTATGGTDTVSNVETLQFSDGKLDISGRFAVHPVSQLSAGDVDQDSAVLLAKLNAAGSVTFQVSTDPAFGTLLVNQVVAVADPLVPAKLQLTNGTLAAGTTYHWRALGADGEVETARFRTPDAVTVQNGFSMGVTGDWRGELAPYPAIKNAATAGLDLFVKLGDTIYADYASPAVNIPQAMTLADYRAKHNEVYSNQAGLDAWGNLQKTTAILVTIDDHEVINDFSGGAPASSDPRRFGTATGLINDTALYETGLTAFIEYNAIEDRTYANTGTAPRTDGEKQLYRYSLQGKDAAVFVLDARSFRDQELAPAASLTDPAAIGNFLVAAANPTRTMLGAPQLAQLKADLLDAQAKGVLWKFIQLPEPIQNFGVLGAEDRYEGYSAERNELLKFINTNNLTGVVFVSADIHGSVTNNLTYQDFPGGPQIATSAWEITTGSVAFDAPFGQTVGALAGAFGLLTPPQTAFYNSLPVAPDTDSALNDKDDFIKSLINQQVTALGYDPIGLNSNLAQANGLINATLVTGDYLVTHGYGWTKFDVDTAGKLTVTTYTVPYYSAAEAAANPAAIAALTPTVAAQFTVNPSLSLSGTAGADSLVGTFGNDTLQGQAGNDTLVAGAGNDMLDGGRGNDSMVGGAGNDTYIVDSLTDMVVEASGEGTDTVLTTVGTYTLGANLENLTYTGAGKLNGTGNAENNIISGGAGADTLSGGLGNDTLVGGGGNDRMDGGAGSDVVVFE
ncbi:MAG: alkaline phosphatase D family protein, partial [Roseococcus sp.]